MSLPLRYRLEDAASASHLPEARILQFVSLSWVHPLDAALPAFDEEDLARIRMIKDLQDLGVHDDDIPVVMRLVDQINRLHLQLKAQA
jgi:hypothetical protein